MTPTVDKPKSEAKSESKPETKPETKLAAAPGAKSDAQKNLKSIPMPELEKKLGSSPDGLSQAEAQKRLAQYGPNEIAEKKDNPFLKFLTYFWGPIPWMIEAAVILSGVVRHWPDFFIILLLLFSNAVVGFWEEHQAGNAIAALKEEAGDQGQSQTRWEVDRSPGARSGAGRRHPPAPGRYCSGGRALAGGRPGAGGSVRADRRIFACRAQTRRCGVFRIDHAPGRNRRHGLRHRHEHLLRQDRATGGGGRNPSAISSEPC